LTGQQSNSIDSENQLNALMGIDQKGHNNMIVQGMQNTMAYHQYGWVYFPPLLKVKVTLYGLAMNRVFQ
jgi:hypothetical protein